METIKYTTLIDFVLQALKEIRQRLKNKYLSLSSLVDYFDYNMPYSDVVGLAKYLETRGWAKVVYMLGDVKVQITTSGILHIDEKGEGFIDEYYKFLYDLRQLGKEEKTKLYEGLINIDEKLINPKEKILNLIEHVSKKITEHEGGKTDYSKDLEIIKLELEKSIPDFRIIEEKLNRFNNLNYLFDDIQELKDYLSNGNGLYPQSMY